MLEALPWISPRFHLPCSSWLKKKGTSTSVRLGGAKATRDASKEAEEDTSTSVAVSGDGRSVRKMTCR